MSYLLDTNVVSELRKGDRSHPNVAAWVASVPRQSLYISVLVIGEVRFGIENARRRDAVFAARLEGWLNRTLRFFDDRILPVDQAVAAEWGRLGWPATVPAVDGLMAATAYVHGMTIVTNNQRDFARTGVPCIDPFEPIQ